MFINDVFLNLPDGYTFNTGLAITRRVDNIFWATDLRRDSGWSSVGFERLRAV
jgi:hypothetical protein